MPIENPLGRRRFLQSSGLLSSAGLLARTTAALAADDATPHRVDSQRHPLLITSNPVIQKGRDAGLAALQPTPADLQHGLELHAQSLVFDAYGFAPRAAIDGGAFAALEAAGASDSELNDAREEMTMTRAARVAAEREELREALACAGVTTILQNAGEEGHDPLRLMKRLARFTYLGDMLPGLLRRAARPADIEAAHAAGQHALYLTANGVPLPERWETVEEELGYIRIFYQLGIRMMHVTYNRRNLLGDGCAEPANGGLSDLGRRAIAEMNRVGVIVDVAHSGWQTSLESARASTKPMVASHTVCDAVQHHIRAKPDDVIRAICDTGGLIGICFIPNFVGGRGDIAAVLDHIDYAVKKFGVDHVAIGTDVAHASQFSSVESAKVKSRGKRRTRFAALWPDGALGGNWPGQDSLAWTNWPLITVGLVQRGYSDADIQQIIGGNMLRVCREVLTDTADP